MFEDDAKLDDIMNVLKQPKPKRNEDDKKKSDVPDTAIRYESRRSIGDDTIRFDFAKSMEVLK
ncbi:MAG: hypothetical protein K6G55_08710 [Selenomonadaceae bacterium]|nr:hypothetical protein [Selenomonadaceae bacterium]